MSQSESLDKLLPALAAFHDEIAPLKPDDKNPHFGSSFTSLKAITVSTRPLLKKHGLLITTRLSILDDNSTGLITTVWHVASAQFLDSQMPLLLAKEDPQGQGSAITYARRYATSAILGLVQDDDDGNQGTQARQQYSNKPQQPKEPLPVCIKCGNTDSAGKSQYSDGYYCYPKKGGCGAKFTDSDIAEAMFGDKELSPYG